MRNFKKIFTSVVAALSAVALLSACTPAISGQNSTNGSKATAENEIDLGLISVGSQEFPVRGEIYQANVETPEDAPIVIVSHLRAPNCSDESYAYPCPEDTSEMRYDYGMTYLGEALAEAGYNVLIPDLGAVLHGQDLTTPYSQFDAWSAVISKLLDETPGDSEKLGLVAHSRSAQFLNVATEKFGLDAAVTYGPFYDEGSNAPTTGEVPVLALMGSLDSDVGLAAVKYVSQFPDQGNFHAVELEGFGHMLVNTIVTTDERVACDLVECADAQEHQDTLREATVNWFSSTLKGDSTAKVFTPSSTARTITSGAKFASPQDFIGGTVCNVPEPMSPNLPESVCPDPVEGVIDAFYTTDLLAVTEETSVTLDEGFVNPRLLLAPLATTGQDLITVTFTLAESGEEVTATLDSQHPALRNRSDEFSSGTYFISELPLSAFSEYTPGTVVSKLKIATSQGLLIRGVLGE